MTLIKNRQLKLKRGPQDKSNEVRGREWHTESGMGVGVGVAEADRTLLIACFARFLVGNSWQHLRY